MVSSQQLSSGFDNLDENPEISAVIFDMDGVIIDSEPLWRIAEMEVFRQVGLDLDESDCLQTMGMRMDAAVDYWYQKKPWRDVSRQEVAHRIEQHVIELIHDRGKAMEGVEDCIEAISESGLALGLATSSAHSVIDAVLKVTALSSRFVSIRSALDEVQGKPHPAVYLSCASELGIDPANCLAIEDSCTGLNSALSAGMKVVAVPAPEDFGNPCFDQASLKLRSLSDFDLYHFLPSIL